MSEFSRETLLNIIETDHVQCGEASALASMALAAMDSEPVEMPLDYLQGHKDGLEWAAQLAEANHPETGDWLYDDPIELAKAIRKGPDMPPAQPVEDSEPDCNERQLFCSTDTARMKKVISVSAGSEATPLYRHAQPVPVVSADLLHTAASAIEDLLTTKDRTGTCVWFDLPFRLRSAANAQPAPVVQEVDADDNFYSWFGREWRENYQHNQYTTAAKQMLGVIAESAWKAGCRAAMLAAAPQSPGSEPATVPGKWIPVSEQMPEVGDIVLTAMGGVVNVGEMECSAANCRFFTSVISGRELPATHWMPLPAGPQEVK
ncbi:TPA: DUF551 domain-containing protein [Klebsiella pneumoniae]|uniref:DUF551 domain-containing protein n=1 Tax=Klebsiella pneumoniae TaxID=573 RepID=UPI0015EAA7A2|nr:DUF551 domain-containing protein [Klebsiella pneumoniae]MBA7836420.1 DUF551 domain-containing protein [Klebsiella pneumoniae]QLT81254.1 DUF551 domain-containing protein [Klebsiella pneumoniae]